MNRFSILGALLIAFAAAVSFAQDTENEEAPAPPTASPPDTGSDDSDDVFIPSEEIPADQEVTFPVDI